MTLVMRFLSTLCILSGLNKFTVNMMNKVYGHIKPLLGKIPLQFLCWIDFHHTLYFIIFVLIYLAFLEHISPQLCTLSQYRTWHVCVCFPVSCDFIFIDKYFIMQFIWWWLFISIQSLNSDVLIEICSAPVFRPMSVLSWKNFHPRKLYF